MGSLHLTFPTDHEYVDFRDCIAEHYHEATCSRYATGASGTVAHVRCPRGLFVEIQDMARYNHRGLPVDAPGPSEGRIALVVARWGLGAAGMRELEDYLAGPQTAADYDRLPAVVRAAVDDLN